MSAPAFESAARDAAQEERVPEQPPQPDIARAEKLLRSASLLLARSEQTEAAHALHAELARTMGQASPAPYDSHAQAQDAHRQLTAELARWRAQHRPSFASTLRSRRLLARRIPQWMAWAAICSIIAFLFFRFGYSLFARWRWQHEHPDGPWVSRYYNKRGFQDYLLTRYDVGINYDWGKGAPAEAMDRDHWSAMWDTCLVVKQKRTVQVSLTADDVGKLWIDDKPKITIKGATTKKAKLYLEPGVHHLRIEYQERRKGAKVRLTGIDTAGNEFYTLQRPRLEGEPGSEKVSCDGKQ